MENEKFVFFSDPGHGWIRVKKTLLEALGIAERITPYSYENGEYASHTVPLLHQAPLRLKTYNRKKRWD